MKVKIANDAFEFVNACVNCASRYEVGGLFTCKKTGDGEFLIDKFYLLEQEVTHGSVDFDGEEINLLIERLAAENKLNDLRGSWHSHGNGNVFWSAIDEHAIDDYKNNNEMPWLLSLVFNTDGDILARIDIFDSSAIGHITMNDLDVEITSSKAVRQKVEELISHRVSKKKYFSGGKRKNKKRKDKDQDAIEAGKRGSGRSSSALEDDDTIRIRSSVGKTNTDKHLWEKPMHSYTDEEWEQFMQENWE